MLVTLSLDPIYWSTRLNGLIALAPLSRISTKRNKFLNLLANQTFTPDLPKLSGYEYSKAIWGPYNLAQKGTEYFCR